MNFLSQKKMGDLVMKYRGIEISISGNKFLKKRLNRLTNQIFFMG